MKKTLSVLLLLYSALSFAQQKLEYAGFLQSDSSLKWAALYSSYVNLSPANPNVNIRNYYIRKAKENLARAYSEDSSSFAVIPYTIGYKDYKASIRPVEYIPAKMNWWLRVDDKKNLSEAIFNKESNNCDSCPLKNSLSFFKVKQLLYYSHQQFYIRNILITPVNYTKAANDLKEDTKYFESSNFAFDPCKADTGSIPATAKFIGRSSNNLVLLPQQEPGSGSRILTLNNWNLCHLLYNDIKNKKLQAYATDKSLYPDPRNIIDPDKLDAYKNRIDEVMIMDSTGEMKGTQKVIHTINFDSIYKFTLVQDFYFDFNREILYSKLIALVPRISVSTSTGMFIGYTDYWGVIFPKEKIKIIKKTK